MYNNSRYEVNEKIERLKQRLQASSVINPMENRFRGDEMKMTG